MHTTKVVIYNTKCFMETINKDTKLLGYARVRNESGKVETAKIMSNRTCWMSNGTVLTIPPEEYSHYLRLLEVAQREIKLTAAASSIMEQISVDEKDYIDDEDSSMAVVPHAEQKSEVLPKTNNNVNHPIASKPHKQVEHQPVKVQHQQRPTVAKQESNTKEIILTIFGIVFVMIGIFVAVLIINPSTFGNSPVNALLENQQSSSENISNTIDITSSSVDTSMQEQSMADSLHFEF